MSDAIKVLTVGAGFMGTLHAKAYEQIAGVRNVGIVTRNYSSSEELAGILGGDNDIEPGGEPQTVESFHHRLLYVGDQSQDQASRLEFGQGRDYIIEEYQVHIEFLHFAE